MNATAPAPARQRTPRPKPARSIRLIMAPTDTMPGLLRVTVGKEATDYFLTHLACDFGRGFQVEKIGGKEVYHVNLDGERRSCDCKGHTRHGHCKHADGLAVLVAAGRL